MDGWMDGWLVWWWCLSFDFIFNLDNMTLNLTVYSNSRSISISQMNNIYAIKKKRLFYTILFRFFCWCKDDQTKFSILWSQHYKSAITATTKKGGHKRLWFKRSRFCLSMNKQIMFKRCCFYEINKKKIKLLNLFYYWDAIFLCSFFYLLKVTLMLSWFSSLWNVLLVGSSIIIGHIHRCVNSCHPLSCYPP